MKQYHVIQVTRGWRGDDILDVKRHSFTNILELRQKLVEDNTNRAWSLPTIMMEDNSLYFIYENAEVEYIIYNGEPATELKTAWIGKQVLQLLKEDT